MVFTRQDLVKSIMNIADRLKDDPSMRAEYNDTLRRAFLKVGSETPDNLACVEHVEYGKVSNRRVGPKEVYGLKVRGTNTLLSEIAWGLETEQGVDLVLSAYPGMTREDAEAALRMLTVVLFSLDAAIIDDE